MRRFMPPSARGALAPASQPPDSSGDPPTPSISVVRESSSTIGLSAIPSGSHAWPTRANSDQCDAKRRVASSESSGITAASARYAGRHAVASAARTP